jgi:hypothetical protein
MVYYLGSYLYFTVSKFNLVNHALDRSQKGGYVGRVCVCVRARARVYIYIYISKFVLFSHYDCPESLSVSLFSLGQKQ